VNTIGPKVWLTPGSISVAVDRLVKKGLVSRNDHASDRRVHQVELTAKGRALITRGFREHAAAMETAISVLSKKERLILLRLLKKLGRHAAKTRE
jgi:MarR family 2-MHQ and catechol resistance regulon transcriptional repressor